MSRESKGYSAKASLHCPCTFPEKVTSDRLRFLFACDPFLMHTIPSGERVLFFITQPSRRARKIMPRYAQTRDAIHSAHSRFVRYDSARVLPKLLLEEPSRIELWPRPITD